MKFSLFFYGIVTGSLVVSALKREFALPRRPYHSVLLALLSIGVLLQFFGR